ncbi:type VII secretion integral membrane protein EccD [Mycobacterium paragordonae]|uniref:Type VII secretion integral membrane protein EccD n=1 Tax=Mycobacterium paragordonae TaxID=1389713 RepID=A0A4R5WTM5_9MYCO|nr:MULTISPECIES: type VII secretion integral membrane protein EccD [Mycobacterium]MDP7734925.1 type VII secretion integral membrane protein EccD [Mycobacterium paragordonae]OBJ75808.1 type VII secretion integral membrane protein EccD [Mycobacterium gordonae]OBK46284.1 type VII secretion integral membrane protein EccD [Mycobacterium gordonae]TDK96325.1 type VII secretion integral membrane protein EccD [Mycobacterium paragordonae]TDK96601.1 type VII secretion integral membrane protein EccD [Myco
MTAVADAPQTDIEGVSSPRAVVVGIMAGEGVQIGVLLDANAPVSVMTDPLLKVINSRLRELGETPLEATGRGRWALCLVDGTPLRATQSLTEQDVYDGDRLWIRFVNDTEHRSQVIEHISTAVSANLSKRFAAIDPVIAVQVGATMVASGVILASGVLGWWRWHHNTWLTTIFTAIVAALVLTVSVMLLMRAKTDADRRAADIMLMSGLVPVTVAAAAAPPGPVGSPQAVLGFGVLTVAAALALRFTGRRLSIYTAIVTVASLVTIASLARMVAATSAVTMLSCLVLACVILYHAAPALSRRLAGIRLPVFPSATSRWVFEARPDLPTTVVRSEGGPPTLEGPASVRDVLLQAERARSFLSGLLVGLGVLMVVCLTALSNPHTHERWLPLLLASFSAGFLLLRGRSYVDRWQAITLATTGVLIIAAVLVRYALVLSSPLSVSISAAILVALPAAGLTAAAVVPNTIYSPLFRKFVEWLEYLCLMPIFPLALWLMNVYAAIRYR